MEPYYEVSHTKLFNKDCWSMDELPDESVDLLVTDPPYGIAFMGKDWDTFNEVVPPQGAYQHKKGFKKLPRQNTASMTEFFVPIWTECLRILKSGAFAFVMCSPRADVMAKQVICLQEAGFAVGFTPIFWAYASGFPKAQNIGKAVDKRLGAEREVIGKETGRAAKPRADIRGGNLMEPSTPIDLSDITAPASPQAKALDGSYGGFQPKPAVEVIIVAMKPLSEKTFVDQALKNRKGITWLDDGRIPYESEYDKSQATPQGRCTGQVYDSMLGRERKEFDRPEQKGRFPANLLVSDDVLNESKEDGIFVPIYGGQKLRDEETGQWTQGEEIVTYALVDKEDYAKVMQYRWNLSTKGYVVCAESKIRNLRLHNLIMQPAEGYEIDHADGNRLDNRKQNLRACTHQQNMMNVNGREGVYEYKDKRKKPFWAYIQRDGKRYSLGYYVTYEEAKEVYENKKEELFGDFASGSDSGSFSRYFDLDKWWAKTFPFLIVPKASKSEKEKLLDMPRIVKSGLPLRDGSGDYVENVGGDGSQSTRRTRTKNIHPTVKPVKLMSYLITLGSREGDTVLDNFGGSGTTAVAARLLGRRCIMYEIKEQYCEMAANRCRQMVLGL